MSDVCMSVVCMSVALSLPPPRTDSQYRVGEAQNPLTYWLVGDFSKKVSARRVCTIPTPIATKRLVSPIVELHTLGRQRSLF